MIKTFRKRNNSTPCYEVVKVDLTTGEVKQFNYNIVDGHLLSFSEYNTSTAKMGYAQSKECLMRLKELNFEAIDNNFLDHYPIYDPSKYTKEQIQTFINSREVVITC
jgi:hypothetical protein